MGQKWKNTKLVRFRPLEYFYIGMSNRHITVEHFSLNLCCLLDYHEMTWIQIFAVLQFEPPRDL